MALIASSLFFFSPAVRAATTYTLSKDRKVISASDGKTFTFVEGGGCGLDATSGNPKKCSLGSVRSYKGPWDEWGHRYYIDTANFIEGVLTSPQIAGTLHHYYFKVVVPVHERQAININVDSPDVVTPAIKENYYWKAGSPPTVTSEAGIVFTGDEANYWLFKASDGAMVKSEDQRTWVHVTPDGVTSTEINMKDFPRDDYKIINANITVYEDAAKKTPVKGAICTFTQIDPVLNFETSSEAPTDENGICAHAGGILKSNAAITISLSGDASLLEKWEGTTTVTYDELNVLYSGEDFIVATKVAKIDNPLEDALKKSLEGISRAISWGMHTVSSWINDAINESAAIDTPVLQNTAKSIRNVALSLVTLALLIIAFANILNVSVAQYGVGRMIPRFIIAIVLAYFSYFISMFLLSMMSAFQGLMLKSMGQNDLTGFNLGIDTLLGINSPDKLPNPLAALLNLQELQWQLVIIVVLLLCMLLIFVWLWIILIVRKAALMVLVVVAPLAFLAMIFPFTEKYYKQWWASFWKWAFIGPAVIFMLLLSKIFLEAWFGQTFSSLQVVGDPKNADSWIYLAVYGVLLFMAGGIPLKMGGEIYSKLGADKMPGKIFDWAKNKTGVPQALDARKASIAARNKERGDKLRASIVAGPRAQNRLLRGLAGVDERQAQAIESSRINDLVKKMEEEDMTKDVARMQYLNATGDERRALARLQAKNGWFDDGNAEAVRRFSEDYSADAFIRNTAAKEQGELLAVADLLGYGQAGPQGAEIFRSAIVTRAKAMGNVADMKAQHISQLIRPENHEELSNLLKNVPKLKKAQESWDDRRMAAMGRAFRSLSIQQRSEIVNAPDMTDEGKAIIDRMVQLDRERSARAAQGIAGNDVLHQVDFGPTQGGKREI